MRHKTVIFLFFLTSFFSYAVEYRSDLEVNSGCPKVWGVTSIKFSGAVYDYFGDDKYLWIVNPKILCSLTGYPAFSISGGIRNDIGPVSVGSHLFLNLLNIGDPTLHQLGHCLDFYFGSWEARINYYLPSTLKDKKNWIIYQTIKQIDSELCYKFTTCSFGCSHTYDFNNQEHCFSFKVGIPFDSFTVGSIISVQKSEPLKLGLSVSYNFSSSEKKDQKSYLPVYRHFPKYDQKVYQKVQKKQSEDIPSLAELLTDESYNPFIPQEAPKETPSLPETWWAWFRRLIVSPEETAWKSEWEPRDKELASEQPSTNFTTNDSSAFSSSDLQVEVDNSNPGGERQGENSPSSGSDWEIANGSDEEKTD